MSKEEHKSCYTCKYRKSYYGFSYCLKTPEKPARLDTYPHSPKCYKEPDYKHNFSRKPKQREKEYIQSALNSSFEAGNCKGCILNIHHLNYCTAFGKNCNTFECYYLL